MFFLLAYMGWGWYIAATAGFLVGSIAAYIISVRWVFAARSFRSRSAELATFLLIGCLGLLVVQCVMWLCIEWFGVRGHCQVVAVGFSFTSNFVLRKLFGRACATGPLGNGKRHEQADSNNRCRPRRLTAALELVGQPDVQVTIVEADDCVGGISRTVNHNGNRIDIGGHRFSKSDWVMQWWANLMPIEHVEDGPLNLRYQGQVREGLPLGTTRAEGRAKDYVGT